MKKTILTATQCSAAKFGMLPKDDDGKVIAGAKPLTQLTDTRGLYLKLMPTNVHSWRFDFKSPESGKRQTLVIGSYPDVSLDAARKRAQEARNMLAEDPPRCPAAVKNARKEAIKQAQEVASKVAKGDDMPGTLKAVALDFLSTMWREEPGAFKNKWSDGYGGAWRDRMERFVFPTLGARMIASIELQELVDVVNAAEVKRDVIVPTANGKGRTIEQGGKHVAFSLRGYLKDTFKRAKLAKLIPANIALDLDDELGKQPKCNAYPAQTTPGGFARVLAAIDGCAKTDHREALQLASLLWQRPENMAGMAWDDLHLDGNVDWFARRFGAAQKQLDLDYTGAVWIIPAEVMKRDKDGKENGLPHLVPLPAQAVEILKRRAASRDPLSPWVFPARVGEGPTDYNTFGDTLRKDLGLKGAQCMHGFRASASTILTEKLGIDEKATEMNLAHSNGLATGVSYQRGIRIDERTVMLQRWADYLDQLRAGNVVQLRQAA